MQTGVVWNGRMAALCLGAVMLTATIGAAQGPGPVEHTLRSLERAAGGSLAVRRSPVTGLATFVSVPSGRSIAVSAPGAAKAAARALAFVDVGGAAFGLRGKQDVVVQSAVGPDELGTEHVQLQQIQDGVPVRGGELI